MTRPKNRKALEESKRRLVTTAPALRGDGHIPECGNGGDDPADCSVACDRAQSAPSPLASVHGAMTEVGKFVALRCEQSGAPLLGHVVALERVVRALPDLMQAWHVIHMTSVMNPEEGFKRPHPGGKWEACPDCRAKLEGR